MDELAFALKAAIGEAKTRQFLQLLSERCRSMGRLLYWQEQAIAKVGELHPEFSSLQFDEILRRLSICHVHGVQMEFGNRAVEIWPAYTSDAYYERVRVEFPNAKMVLYDEGGDNVPQSEREVYYCLRCREALIEWNRGRPRKFGLPRSFEIPPVEQS